MLVECGLEVTYFVNPALGLRKLSPGTGSRTDSGTWLRRFPGLLRATQDQIRELGAPVL